MRNNNILYTATVSMGSAWYLPEVGAIVGSPRRSELRVALPPLPPRRLSADSWLPGTARSRRPWRLYGIDLAEAKAKVGAAS
jgi:hypothetical protein